MRAADEIATSRWNRDSRWHDSWTESGLAVTV